MTLQSQEYMITQAYFSGVYRGDGTAWLIMNFYKFGSLDKYIEQNSDIPVSKISSSY